jgi:hypothetical protein
MSVRAKGLTPDWVPVSLKSKSWNWLGRFAKRLDHQHYCALINPQESSKKETSPGAGRDADGFSEKTATRHDLFPEKEP